MSSVRRLLPLLLLCGCSKLLARDAPASDEAPAEQAADLAAAAPAPAAETPRTAGAPGRYGVPFAWERSPDEPLAKARQYMADVLKDNLEFSSRGRERIARLAQTEQPRATVLACSDSRVQPSVWDATPENDSYSVRNLGNQLATALGSIEYGVEALRTPVLLIVGHTGCDAVARALGGAPAHQGAIARELAQLAPLLERGRQTGHGPSEAVVGNVNAQVAQAVSHFAGYVQSGELTVVGAVYDVKNELGSGAGRLLLVNVNGNVEPARVKAFEEAVNEQNRKAAAAARRPNPEERARGLLDGSLRLKPGSGASINAVSIVGKGGLDALTTGGWRPPATSLSPDVKLARERRPAPPAPAAASSPSAADTPEPEPAAKPPAGEH